MGDMADLIVGDIVGGRYGVYVPPSPVCKYCGRKGLAWVQVDGKWRLHEQFGGAHKCAAYATHKEKQA